MRYFFRRHHPYQKNKAAGYFVVAFISYCDRTIALLLYRVSINRWNFKNLSKFYFLRRFYSVRLIVVGNTSSIFGCISIPLRVHHQSYEGHPTGVQFLAMLLLTHLQ